MDETINKRIEQTITENPITLFMKGTKEEPMCGFSAQVIHILNSYNIPYHSINVLDDWDIREGIKEYSNWPTIPQLYVSGKFVGGCDITMELHRKGEMQDILKQS
jgi:monothiol glutaredoxin